MIQQGGMGFGAMRGYHRRAFWLSRSSYPPDTLAALPVVVTGTPEAEPYASGVEPLQAPGAGTSFRRPCSLAKAHASISGGVIPRFVSAVQT